MLCIILTRSKLFAGVYTDTTELLPLSSREYIDYGGKTMLQVLDTNLDKIGKAYEQYAKKANLNVPKRKIPTSVAFAVGNLRKDGSLYDSNEIHDFFSKSKNAANFDLLYAEHLPLSYLRGMNGNPKLAKESCVVLEAMDDCLNLCYCNIPNGKLNGKAQGTDAFRYISYKEIGQSAAMQGLLDEVVSQFTNAGLKVDAKSKASLMSQLSSNLSKPASDSTYSLNRSTGRVSIKAELNLSARRHEEVSVTNLPSLKDRLSKEQVDSLGINKVVLLGEYLDNRVLKDYLTKDLRLGAKVLNPLKDKSQGELLAITKGVGLTAKEIAKLRAEEARRRAEEEARRKAVERERRLKEEREKLLTDIRHTCVDASKKNDYEERFAAIGAKLNMPREVIVWNIQEALSSASLQVAVTPASTSFASSSRSTQVAVSNPNGNKIPSLQELFDIKGVLIDPEFATKKATLRGKPGNKVVRMIDRASIGNRQKMANFEKLYNKELVYYQELSEIKDVAEGKYYYRDFIPRFTLKEYVKKVGLDKKASFEKLSSKDIKFVMSIFDEVRSLPVPHANLNEFNILVLQEGLLKRTTEIKFVGFTSEDCSVSKMEERIHTVFSTLMKPKVYAEFRKNLNL